MSTTVSTDRVRDGAVAPVAEPAGLKTGAIGFLSNVVIGVSSTAPAYSMAATLGLLVAVAGVGTHAPAVLLVSFVPMFCISLAYRALNRADPDCGTSFAWVTRALGPRLGWMTGFTIFIADVIVMATLSEIAGKYLFLLLGWDSAARSTLALVLAAVAFIALMTWITYRGIELSARVQQALIAIELGILGLLAVVALVKVYGGSAGAARDPSVDRLGQPVRAVVRDAGRRDPARRVRLLGLGRLRDRQRGVAGQPPRPRQGGGRLDPDPAGDVRAGGDGGPVGRRARASSPTTRPTCCRRSATGCSAAPSTSC